MINYEISQMIAESTVLWMTLNGGRTSSLCLDGIKTLLKNTIVTPYHNR